MYIYVCTTAILYTKCMEKTSETKRNEPNSFARKQRANVKSAQGNYIIHTRKYENTSRWISKTSSIQFIFKILQ